MSWCGCWARAGAARAADGDSAEALVRPAEHGVDFAQRRLVGFRHRAHGHPAFSAVVEADQVVAVERAIRGVRRRKASGTAVTPRAGLGAGDDVVFRRGRDARPLRPVLPAAEPEIDCGQRRRSRYFRPAPLTPVVRPTRCSRTRGGPFRSITEPGLASTEVSATIIARPCDPRRARDVLDARRRGLRRRNRRRRAAGASDGVVHSRRRHRRVLRSLRARRQSKRQRCAVAGDLPAARRDELHEAHVARAQSRLTIGVEGEDRACAPPPCRWSSPRPTACPLWSSARCGGRAAIGTKATCRPRRRRRPNAGRWRAGISSAARHLLARDQDLHPDRQPVGVRCQRDN